MVTPKLNLNEDRLLICVGVGEDLIALLCFASLCFAIIVALDRYIETLQKERQELGRRLTLYIFSLPMRSTLPIGNNYEFFP